MRSNANSEKDIIKKAKAIQRKRIILTTLTLSIFVILAFSIGCSNRYEDSYVSYLQAYASTEEPVAFRFVDEKSAIVQLENKAYPCSYEATSQTEFTLTVVQEEKQTTYATSEEEPSIFYLEFWDTSAKLSWNILGVKIERILSITDECNIPAGLWSLCATQDGDDAEIVEKKNGAGWTLILENGESYTGEGMDSAWKTKFISIGNTLFQCMFDPISGVILDASVFIYDETTFDYPVIRENYVSDGEPYYFYSRLLQEDEKLDFYGGTFNAAVVLREAENHYVASPSELHKEISKWQLSPEESQEETTLPLAANLTLNEDGTAKLQVSGDKKYNGTFNGNWYALRHTVLVTLNKKSNLFGNVFTVYASSGVEAATGRYIQEYGQSRIDSFGCYKIGYFSFDYYVLESHAKIFWGNEWTADKLTPAVKYETEYFLTGEYYYEYFDGDPDVADANYKTFDEAFLQPLPINGQVSVVFHEDGTATITHADGSIETRTFIEEGQSITLNWEVNVYQGKNAVGRNPWYPDNVNERCIVQLKRLSVGFTSLYYESRMDSSYVYSDENGNLVQEDYYTIYYRIYLTPKF